MIGLYKTEVVRSGGPRGSLEDVERATLEPVRWFNHHRLLEPTGYVPPVEYEESHSRQGTQEPMAALTEPAAR